MEEEVKLDRLQGIEAIKATRIDVQLRSAELIYGNPVVLGILVLGVLVLAVICIPYAKESKDIIIPGLSGIGGLAGGVAIERLRSKWTGGKE